MSDMTNYLEQPVFLCGYPKSGTTLLLSLLDNHPQLNVFPEELKIFTKVVRKKTHQEKIACILSETGAYVPSLGNVDFPSGKRDYTDINGTDYMQSLNAELSKSQNDKELVQAIYKNWELYAKNTKQGDHRFKYFVEKTPGNEKYIYIYIKKWFPLAKYIYIIRDPRDNYLSKWKKSNYKLKVEQFCYDWKNSVHQIDLLKDSEFILLRYEDLVVDVKSSMEKISNFLKIDFHESLLVPTRNGSDWSGNSMFGDNQRTVHSAPINRYKKKLSVDNICVIEKYLFHEMKNYGYTIDYAKHGSKLPWSFILKRLVGRIRSRFVS